MKIQVGSKEYDVKEAHSLQEKQEGLSKAESLPEGEGMLFFFDPPEMVEFTMEDTSIPLDIIFIDSNLEVVQVSTGKPHSKEPIPCQEPVAYVLEVGQGSGIQVGDDLSLEDDKGPVMKVLASDGSTQMELWGGERIFSRKNTAVLIRKARKAEASNDDKDYKALGRYIFKCIKILDERPAEYVDAPEPSK